RQSFEVSGQPHAVAQPRLVAAFAAPAEMPVDVLERFAAGWSRRRSVIGDRPGIDGPDVRFFTPLTHALGQRVEKPAGALKHPPGLVPSVRAVDNNGTHSGTRERS